MRQSTIKFSFYVALVLLSMVYSACNNNTRKDCTTPGANCPPLVIVIQPYGDFPANLVKAAEEGIKANYKLDVKIAKAIPLPKSGWYEPRQRYIADSLVVDLYRHMPANTFKIVGLTTKDISTEKGEIKNYGIMGLGTLSGFSCVVSTFRLGKNNASQDLIKQRFVKVLNHEVGHTLGLDHCTTPHCLMQDARGTIKTIDGESGKLCAECVEKVSGFVK